MARKLTVLFEGIRNTPKDRTSVVRLFKLIDTTSSDGDEQLPPFYDKGVDTHALDQLSDAHRSWPRSAANAPPHVHGVRG